MSVSTSKSATKKPAAPAATRKTKQAAQPIKGTSVTPEQRYNMIAEAAYYRAEARGFVGGEPAQDWVEAEAEIDAALGLTH